MTAADTPTGRVAQRQVDKFEQRRRELADAALQTLSELGYARTSLREIAQNSPFSHGVLHYYFRDKVDLITYCVRQYKTECVHRYDDIVAGSTTAEQLSRDFGARLAETMVEDAAMHRLWYDLRAQALFEDSFRSDVLEIDAVLDAQTVEHPDEVLGGEVAGGRLGVRAAAQPTGRRVDGGDPAAQRGEGVGQRLAVGVVEVHGELVDADPGGDARVQHGVDVAGGAGADRVAEGDLRAPALEEPGGHRGDLGGRDRALPGIAPAHRHVTAHGQPGLTGPLQHRREHLELGVECPVEVALGERLGGAGEHRDVREPGGDGPVQPALVRHEHRVVDAVAPFQHGDQLLGVGELGHPLRVHEAGGFQRGEPGVGEPAQELRLHRDRNDRLLVLQSVARADLVDGDALRQAVRRHPHGQRPGRLAGHPRPPLPGRAGATNGP